jgi:hypothetical protein
MDPGMAGLQSQQLNALDDFFVELKANCLMLWKAAFETVCQRFYFEGDEVAKMVVHIFECAKALPVGEAELPLPIDTATYASLIKDLASIGFVQMPHGSAAGVGGAAMSYVVNKETWAMILPDCILECVARLLARSPFCLASSEIAKLTLPLLFSLDLFFARMNELKQL